MITTKQLKEYCKEHSCIENPCSLHHAAKDLHRINKDKIQFSNELLQDWFNNFQPLEKLAEIVDYKSYDWNATLAVWERVATRNWKRKAYLRG
ncbi:hypothetical protein [Cognatishimia sp.]|uniref:hypothetical protein n=1 Tax=Cognatishimia sp. TaxID=2211648 RepID=UPI003518B147|nr:hypothetical protein [Cognatishimia sp.]